MDPRWQRTKLSACNIELPSAFSQSELRLPSQLDAKPTLTGTFSQVFCCLLYVQSLHISTMTLLRLHILTID